jgi:arylsulfatase A-like enzyme
MRNEEIVERPADQNTITKRYTEEAVKFINENKKRPFFLYLAHNLPHVPLFASNEFRGRSKRGLYGDVIEEIDWSVGRILETLRKQKLDKNTIVIFTSDNGPWALYDEQGGSAGHLFGAKGTGYEGGQRVPAVFWGPGRIRPGVISDMGSTLDILPTIAQIAGIDLPSGRKLDGYDLSGVLFKGEPSPRKEMFFYHGTKIFAARQGDYKLHFYENNPIGYPGRMRELDTSRLFNLSHDPSERFDIASDHPEIIEAIKELTRLHRLTVDSVGTQLEKRIIANKK